MASWQQMLLVSSLNMSMKIVLVHNTYQQPGGEDVVVESEKRLLEGEGHQVIPYFRSNMELQNAPALARIAIVPRLVWSSETRRDFAALLDAERPDVVHVHNTFMVISPSIYSACSERKIPVVQTLHNFRLLCPSANFYRDGHVYRKNTWITDCSAVSATPVIEIPEPPRRASR